MKRRTLQISSLHAALLLGAVVTLTPLAWMVSASLMPAGDANVFPPRFLPRKITFEHYVALFTRLDLARHFMNSVVVTVTATVLSVILNGLAGYAFAKLVFPGREKLFRALTLALVIPSQVGMLPLFLLLREMGFVNTYAGVIVPYLASVLGIFMVRQYVVGVPDDLLHAARVDGAGEFRLFWSVVVPVIQPILVTLAAFTFLSAWNDFMWPLIVLSDDQNYTLPVALANLVGEHVLDTELMMAGSVLTILPALLVFLVFQRAYVRGILAGSVKG
ncbi:MAG TPA: carbohydrate ABC transporter permease [Candidatus Krumholzibacteria bacterium]|nr:carbohydrate ABC transporter permease [Candidatus Krumholzibacteria bacterium]